MFQSKWKKLKEVLKDQTHINFCKVCFQKIESSFIDLFNPRRTLCNSCFNKLNPRLKTIMLDDIKGMGIYPYEDVIKELIYQYKGCYDIELKYVFLEPYKFLLKLKYKKYIVIPIPSYVDADKKRGFNHVKEIIKSLDLESYDCLEKIEDIKQSSLNYFQRKEKVNNFKLKEDSCLKGKNVLIVDDVLTTGETMKACIKLLKKLKPNKISFLVISYSNRFMSKFDERK